MSDPVPENWGALDLRRLGRLMTALEERSPDGLKAAAALQAQTWPGITIGITGPPGAGKSTLISALVRELRRRRERVGIVAVDPSSARTGGAFLGDRVRMMEHAIDSDVVIRSIASRGHVGGSAPVVADLARLLRAAGFAWVLIETVGAGQVEIDIARQGDVTVLVQAPGQGDEIQALKKGILELADLVVVNKSDLAGAVELQGQLATWAVASENVLLTCAESGEGVDALVDAIGRIQRMRPVVARDQRRDEVRALALTMLTKKIDVRLENFDCAGGSTWEAAERLVASLRQQL